MLQSERTSIYELPLIFIKFKDITTAPLPRELISDKPVSCQKASCIFLGIAGKNEVKQFSLMKIGSYLQEANLRIAAITLV